MTQKERAEAILGTHMEKVFSPLWRMGFADKGYAHILDAMIDFLEQETKTVECFVPVSVEDDVPDYYKTVFALVNDVECRAWRANDGDNDIWTLEDSDLIIEPTHWLKKTTIKAISK